MCKQTGGGLLDCLLQDTGSHYLSDLRLDPRLGVGLLRALERLPAERFSREQWADAFFYLTKEQPAAGDDAAALRRRLLERLGRSGAGGKPS